MFKHTLFFVLLIIGLDAFSQGANSPEHEVISRVYFGSLPYDATDIMNPPVGTTIPVSYTHLTLPTIYSV